MLEKLRKMLPFGRALAILPLILALLLSSCGGVLDSLVDEGVIEDAILDYIDKNVDDYNDSSAGEEDDSVKVPESDPASETKPEAAPTIDENGAYTTKEDVALYIYTYGRLPDNFITKQEAEALGWEGGSLEPYAEGMCIGGNQFGNYEGLLPKKSGRTYTECDIDTMGAKTRGAKRIVFSNDGLIYYTDDHYESFELLYGNP